jgi:glycosyltransferase involved in cell wall biosynthesis
MILYLGGFNPRKGLHILLAGAERFMDDSCSLVIAGYTDPGCSGLKRVVRRTLARMGLTSHQERMKKQIAYLRQRFSEQSVLTVGFRRDVPQLIAASDLLVFPATVPHFARPVIEAAVMAKPAVASAIGGIPELIEDRRTGILVPANSPALLADAVHRILSSPEDRDAMGEQAFKRARELFDAESNAKAVEHIYVDLGGGAP